MGSVELSSGTASAVPWTPVLITGHSLVFWPVDVDWIHGCRTVCAENLAKVDGLLAAAPKRRFPRSTRRTRRTVGRDGWICSHGYCFGRKCSDRHVRSEPRKSRLRARVLAVGWLQRQSGYQRMRHCTSRPRSSVDHDGHFEKAMARSGRYRTYPNSAAYAR